MACSTKSDIKHYPTVHLEPRQVGIYLSEMDGKNARYSSNVKHFILNSQHFNCVSVMK